MEFINFPIVALGAALVCLIGITLYSITQRSSLRSRDEQLVVARAQAYAMLELSQAGVLFLDREHKLMGEASAAAPELLPEELVEQLADGGRCIIPVGPADYQHLWLIEKQGGHVTRKRLEAVRFVPLRSQP